MGCGPFYGTRCDSGVGGIYGARHSPGPELPDSWGFGFGGGFDPLNAEASAILQSFPGFEGTATVGMNGLTTRTPGWTTTNRNLVQPGTIGFEGGPVCTRNVGGRLVVLPGCRGAQSITFDFTAGVWRVTFDDGYNVAQDGCVFGATLVVARSSARTRTARPSTSRPAAARPPRTRARAITTTSREPTTNGAGTLFHPLAGCKTEAQVYSSDAGLAGRQCDFRNRNFGTNSSISICRIPTPIFRRRRSSAASWRPSPGT